jgi:N utilization substance protein A
MDKGDIEIFLEREIVDQVVDPNLQISIDEVNKKGNSDELEVGEDFVEKLPLASFGRRLIILAKQSLNQKIRDIEKDIVYNEYQELMGEIVVGDIYQIRKSDILVNHNKNELLLPRHEQIPYEKYKKGETIRAIVKEVNKNNSGPQIVISRSDNLFLRRLFEIEIPEIYDGIIEIKSIAREPGERAKIAVESQDKRIDAVGACVGMKGVRIHAIVRELNNENIDVVNYSADPTKNLSINAQ